MSVCLFSIGIVSQQCLSFGQGHLRRGALLDVRLRLACHFCLSGRTTDAQAATPQWIQRQQQKQLLVIFSATSVDNSLQYCREPG